MTEEPHDHVWKASMHLDGCHFYEWFYSCSCGASRHVWAERNFKGDPYSYVWTEGTDCERCRELENGARRKRRVDEIVEAKG